MDFLSSITSRPRIFIQVLLSFVIIASSIVTFAAAQVVTTSPVNCVPDFVSPGRNIAEITGNTPLVQYSISGTINNCYIFIHDLNCVAITIASAITNNSNISIQNVVSSNKTSYPTFIFISAAITDFGFINISNVSHSSLVLNETTGNTYFSILKINPSVTGKADMTSWISMSELNQDNVWCDRTADTSMGCLNALVYMNAAFTNISSISMKKFSMTNISMLSNLTGAAGAHAVLADVSAFINVTKFEFLDFVIQNVSCKNFGSGSCGVRGFLSFVSFSSSLLSSSSSSTSASSQFIVQNSVFSNIASYAGGTTASSFFLVSFSLSDSITGYDTVRFQNISLNAVSSTSLTASASVGAIQFQSSVTTTSRAAENSSSSLTVNNIQFENIVSVAETISGVVLFSVGAVENFTTLKFNNITIATLNCTASTSRSNLRLLYFASSISTPQQLSSSSSSSSSAPLLLMDNIRMENAIADSTSPATRFWLLYVADNVTNYTTIQFSNFVVTNCVAMCRNADSSFKVVFFGGFVTALPSTSHNNTSLLLIENVTIRNVTASASGALTDASLWGFSFSSNVANFATISVRNFKSKELTASSENGSATVYGVLFSNPISTPALSIENNNNNNSSASLFAFDDCHMVNVRCTSVLSSKISMLHVTEAISNYSVIRLSNIVASTISGRSLSSSISGYSQIFLLSFLNPVSTIILISSGNNNNNETNIAGPSFIVENATINNIESFGEMIGSDVRFLHMVSELTNYSLVRFSNVSSTSIKSTSSEGFVNIIMFYIQGTITSLFFPFSASSVIPVNVSTSTTFVVDNLRMENATSTGFNTAQIWLFATSAINNYSLVQFSNLEATGLHANSTSTYGNVYAVYLFSNVISFRPSNDNKSNNSALSSLVFDNVRMSDVSSVANLTSDLRLISVTGVIQNFTTISLKNLTADGWTTTSVVGNVLAYLTLLQNSVTFVPPPLSSSSFSNQSLLSSFIVDQVYMRNVSAIARASSSIVFLPVSAAITNYLHVQFSNIHGSSLLCSSDSGASSVYMFLVTGVGVDFSGDLLQQQQTKEMIEFKSVAASSFSSMEMTNISLQNATAIGTLAAVRIVYTTKTFSNFSTFKITNIVGRNLTAIGKSGTAVVYLVPFSTSIWSSSSMSSSSSSKNNNNQNFITLFLVDNVTLENTLCVANGASQVSVMMLSSSLIDFDTIQFSNIVVSGVNVTSTQTSAGSIYLIALLSDVMTRNNYSSSSQSPSLVLENMTLQNGFVNGIVSSLIYIVYASPIIANYSDIRMKNISASSVQSTVNGTYQCYLLFMAKVISTIESTSTSLAMSPKIEISTIKLQNITVVNSGSSQVTLVYASQGIINYRTILFSNMIIDSVNVTSAALGASIALLRLTGVVDPGKFSSSSSTINSTVALDNIAITNSNVKAGSTSTIYVLLQQTSITNFDSISFSNISMQNTSSIAGTPSNAASASTVMFSLAGASNCSNGFSIKNAEMRNVTTATLSLSATATMYLFTLGAAMFNMSQITIENTRIHGGVYLSAYLRTRLRAFELANFQFVNSLTMKNNSVVLSSPPTPSNSFVMTAPLITTVTLATMSILAASPSRFELNIENNNSIEILDDHQQQFPSWQDMCAEGNCSLLRINSIDNTSTAASSSPTIINIADGNFLKSSTNGNASLSFIAFSIFPNPWIPPSSLPLTLIYFQYDNYLNVSEKSKIISFDSLRQFPPFTTWPFVLPSLAHIEIGCNLWNRAAESTMAQELISATSFSQYEKFVNFTCRTDTESRSGSTNYSASSSASITSPASATSSVSSMRSRTFSVSESPSNKHSSSSSHTLAIAVAATPSQTQSKSRTVLRVAPAPPPQVPIVTAGITTTVVAVTATGLNPTLGSLAIRNGLLFLGAACGLPLGPLDAATSPTGAAIGDDQYQWWSGAVVFDYIIVVASFPVLLIPTIVYVKWFRKGRPWFEYLIPVRSIAGTLLLIFSGPIVVGFIASYGFAESAFATLFILFCGASTLGVVTLWPLWIVWKVKKEMTMEPSTTRKHVHHADDPNATCEHNLSSRIKVVVEYLFAERTETEWSPRRHQLRISWSFLFEHSASLLFVCFETVCGLGINVTLGLLQDPTASQAECRIRAILNLCFHVPPTAFLIFANPLLSRFDAVVSTVMWIGNMFSSLMLVMKFFEVGIPIDETLEVAGLILAILNLIASIGIMLGVWDSVKTALRHLKSGGEEDNNNNALSSLMVNEHGDDVDLNDFLFAADTINANDNNNNIELLETLLVDLEPNTETQKHDGENNNTDTFSAAQVPAATGEELIELPDLDNLLVIAGDNENEHEQEQIQIEGGVRL